MAQASSKLFDRPDTMFGVCEGIGQDFGFNPNYLRVAFGVGLLWNPMIVAATYLVLGVAVLVSRVLSPTPAIEEAPVVEAIEEEEEFPLAKAA